MNIKMTSIPVHDPIKAFKFYTEILGFEKFMYDEKGKLAIVVSPNDKTGTSLLLEPNDMQEYSSFQAKVYEQKIPVITFSVEDLKSEYIRLTNLDVHFIKSPKEEDWGWEAIFDDDQGNYIQLIQE